MSSFFHTLVVVGAGLSLANCGGKARSDENGPANGGTGSGASGSASGGGSSAGTVGAGGTSSAGTVGVGGTIVVTAGTSAGGGIAAGGRPSGGAGGLSFGGGMPWAGMGGLMTQWSCGGEFYDCWSTELGDLAVSAIPLDRPCPVDPSRPTSPDDCGPGEGFQCVVARYRDQALLVNCTCSGADAGASCLCPAQYAGCIEGRNEYCADGVSLCGCARTCILL